MDGGQGVLGQQHLEEINKGLQQAAEAERQIELAKRAGEDVSKYEQQNQQTIAKLTQLKQVYFPNG